MKRLKTIFRNNDLFYTLICRNDKVAMYETRSLKAIESWLNIVLRNPRMPIKNGYRRLALIHCQDCDLCCMPKPLYPGATQRGQPEHLNPGDHFSHGLLMHLFRFADNLFLVKEKYTTIDPGVKTRYMINISYIIFKIWWKQKPFVILIQLQTGSKTILLVGHIGIGIDPVFISRFISKHTKIWRNVKGVFDRKMEWSMFSAQNH